MVILGINAYHGDAAAVLIRDGRIVLAIEEERLSRVKHVAGFPTLAVQACLDEAGLTLADLDHVAIGRDPSQRFLLKALHALRTGPRLLRSVRDRLTHAARVRSLREDLCGRLDVPAATTRFKVHAVEHHRAHVASAFLVSPFEHAACVSIDGFGDFASTLRGEGRGGRITVLDRVLFPHSLGLFYTAISQFIGFRHYGEEGTVMGLAPYGQPRFLEEMRRLVKQAARGLFELNLAYFRHASHGVEMSWHEGPPTIGTLYTDRLVELFGPPREPRCEITERDRDLAASLQVHLEDRVLDLLTELHRLVPSPNLCVAGGVAFNCVTMGKIRARTPFRNLFVQAAAGDAGTALGAAAHVFTETLGLGRPEPMTHAYLGPSYSDETMDAALAGHGFEVDRMEPPALQERTAAALANGAVVGWFQGRGEFGPRALGNRSIVADPRRAEMKDILNRRVKHREPFRPFAPSVLEEEVGTCFEDDHPSPFMASCVKFREDWTNRVPAVDHVDHSGRLQTVSRATNEPYWLLIDAFRRLTGIPLVLNTSFNENEPIACTPQDAVRCFEDTEIDVLVLGTRYVRKKGRTASA